MREYRLKREDYWIKKLRTVYPYGLNERTKFMNEDAPVGRLFPALPRYGEKYLEQRARPHRNLGNPFSELDIFVEHVNSIHPNSRGNEVRKRLDGFKQKHLKSLAAEAHKRLGQNHEIILERLYKLLLDTFLLLDN